MHFNVSAFSWGWKKKGRKWELAMYLFCQDFRHLYQMPCLLMEPIDVWAAVVKSVSSSLLPSRPLKRWRETNYKCKWLKQKLRWLLQTSSTWGRFLSIAQGESVAVAVCWSNAHVDVHVYYKQSYCFLSPLGRCLTQPELHISWSRAYERDSTSITPTVSVLTLPDTEKPSPGGWCL